eukprot:3400712-Pyramimonas_sp.AAC.1
MSRHTHRSGRIALPQNKRAAATKASKREAMRGSAKARHNWDRPPSRAPPSEVLEGRRRRVQPHGVHGGRPARLLKGPLGRHTPGEQSQKGLRDAGLL